MWIVSDYNVVQWMVVMGSVMLASVHTIESEHYSKEYCVSETFRPQCMKREVILMESAVYGRRYRGRCLEAEEPDFAENPRYMGCSTSVIGQLDAKCSGRKQCEIRIPDADLQQTRPCPKGLDMFLEVRYSCIEVIEEDRSCVVSVTSSPLHVARPSRSSESNAGLHCGTKRQPWLLEAPAGQQLNITLLDFTPTSTLSVAAAALTSESQFVSPASMHASIGTESVKNNCAHRPKRQYGYIIDKSVRKNVSFCGGDGSHRLSNVHLSSGNVVELVLIPENDSSDGFNFLLGIEAVGCSDLIPPEDMWLKRTVNEAIVGCYTSRQTWHLKCEDRRWIGVVSNCTQFSGASLVGEQKQVLRRSNEFDGHEVILIVTVAFVGLAVCLTIICCGIYCLRRYSEKGNLDAKIGSKYSCVQLENKCRKPDRVSGCIMSGQATAAAGPGRSNRSNSAVDGNGSMTTHGWNTTSTPQYFVLDQDAVALNSDKNV